MKRANSVSTTNTLSKERNRTSYEAARTMLIFAKDSTVTNAESVATAVFNTLIDLYRLFGSLCYPTNDYDDVGKLKAKADIGIFVGYAPTKKAYRIYNKTNAARFRETDHRCPSNTEHELTALSVRENAALSTLSKKTRPPSDPPKQRNSNVFDTYNAPETDSEASSSNSVNIDVTPNNQLPHVQKWTQAHPLENIIGDKDRTTVSTSEKQLENRRDVVFSSRKFLLISEHEHGHLPDGRKTRFPPQRRLKLKLSIYSQPEGFVDPEHPSACVCRHQESISMDSSSTTCMFVLSHHTIDTPMAERPNLDEDKGGKLIDPTRFRGVHDTRCCAQILWMRTLNSKTMDLRSTKFRCIVTIKVLLLYAVIVFTLAYQARLISVHQLHQEQVEKGKLSKGRTVADSIAERLTRPTAYKFKTDCSIILSCDLWNAEVKRDIRTTMVFRNEMLITWSYGLRPLVKLIS
ncbi:hypothetical protein Tco_1329243 [Tanacetum coccineum]